MVKTKAAERPEQGTKERIRLAAMHEFSTHGFSGARVDRIAVAAKVNIRMIYYFFGSKKRLLEAVLSEIFLLRKAQLVAGFDNVSDLLTSYFDGYAEDPQRVRLLEWEALQTKLPSGAKLLTNYKDRQDVIRRRLASIVDLQKRKVIPGNLDPKMLYLMFVALSIYPMTYPQSVFIATGEHSADEKFKRKYRGFLKQMADALFSTRSRARAPTRSTRGGKK